MRNGTARHGEWSELAVCLCLYACAAAQTPDYEGEKAVRVAQATVASLQQRLEKKDETIARLEQLLKGAREEAERAGKQHVQELARLQQRLGAQTSDAYQRFKGITVELLGQHQQSTQLHNKQVCTNAKDSLFSQPRLQLRPCSELVVSTRHVRVRVQ